MTTNPNTVPERIELPNGCYWQPITKDTGYIFDAKGRYLTDVIGVTEANNLRLAMSPAPSADAVECARKVIGVLGYSVHAGWKDEFIANTAKLVQQYGDARVAEVKAANEGLREALETMKRVAGETYNKWDADEDSKVGKWLAAMAGNKGIRPDVDDALAVLDGLPYEGLTASDYEECLADHRRLVRELDVLLNGEEGAAKQASLCDIVGQVADKRWKLISAAQPVAAPSQDALVEAAKLVVNKWWAYYGNEDGECMEDDATNNAIADLRLVMMGDTSDLEPELKQALAASSTREV